MKHMYFIRHVNADYLRDNITDMGYKQLEMLNSTLYELLPEQIEPVVGYSDSGRTNSTLREILPTLENKSKNNVEVFKETCLSQLRSMGGIEDILKYGCENATYLMDKYCNKEYGFFVSHDKIIVGTVLAVAEMKGIEVPDYFKSHEEVEVDESFVDQIMDEFGYSRGIAIEKAKKFSFAPMPMLFPIGEGSIIHLDINERNFNYVTLPNLNLF